MIDGEERPRGISKMLHFIWLIFQLSLFILKVTQIILPGKWWGSWHAAGTGESPGSAGPTCEYGNPSYCYESCASRPQGCDPKGCDWASGYDKCDDEKFAEFILTVDGICYEDDTTSYKYELNDCVSTGM